MNGNVSEAGIQADLEWMNRVGIGGVQRFDAGGVMASYAFTKPRLIVGDPNWRSAVHKAAEITDRLGLDQATATSPGWSLTGGPWVTPAQAMKKYVWSETIVEGGKPITSVLAPPPATTGSFQNASTASLGGSGKNQQYYSDALVVAYRQTPAERQTAVPASITSSGGKLDADRLSDGDFAATQSVSSLEALDSVVVTVSYSRPVTVRGLVLGLAGRAASDGERKPLIEISDDGRRWRAGVTLSGPADAVAKVYAFKPLTARHFRLMLPPEPPPPAYKAPSSSTARKGPFKIALSELVLRTEGTVNRFTDKAGFGAEPIVFRDVPTPDFERGAVIGRNDVVDLTDRLAADGTLRWTPPPGRWRVIRLGYSLLGRENGPAQAEATGLEVDKFNPAHIRSYLNAYLGRFAEATGPSLIGSRGLQSLVADSWEAGLQNWTEAMPAEFRVRRGYDMVPWVPVLTGRVVGSAEDSERFLWDFRRTIQDLTAQHYKVVADELHKRGMTLSAEAQGDNWRALADGMEIKSRADIPMAEYWFRSFAAGPGQPSLKTDMKEAASVAHLYGKPFAANESLTVASSTPWAYAPSQLKPVIDEIFAYGINRFVLHTSVHQPVDRKPGLALGPFGQYINRNETWAEQAKPFFDYIARASYLLQQGRYVADIAYFYGEDRPLVSLFKGKYDEAGDRYMIEVPFGTGYDFINAETLHTATTVEGNVLATSGGMRYRLIYLGPDTSSLTLATLKRLRTLVEQGAVLVGSRPQHRLGMAGTDEEFAAVADSVWGQGRGIRSVGRGRVYPSQSIPEVLASEKIGEDVTVLGPPDANVLQLHRRLEDGSDIYFLTNRKPREERMEVTFRTAGRRPELWDANTGNRTPLAFRTTDGRTTVPITLASQESAFIVFREPTALQIASVPTAAISTLRKLEGPWQLRFPPGLGAPLETTLPVLASWSEHTEPGVRYFSGTARYLRTLQVPKDWRRTDRRIMLDLGDVREVAQIRINGRDMGVLWKAPYRADVTDALRPGTNQVEISVTNLWPNRIIGDLQPTTTNKVSWIEYSPIFARNQWKADSKLLPSGLLGPVRFDAVTTATPAAAAVSR